MPDDEEELPVYRYRVGAYWGMYGEVEVEATSEAEARDIAGDMDLDCFNGEYSDGSFEVQDADIIETDEERAKRIAKEAKEDAAREARLANPPGED